MEILGYNSYQINELISGLISKGFIEYAEDLLLITAKGITFLIANNQDKLSILSDNINTPHIHPEKAWPIETPYVPEKFTEKFKR